MAWNPSLSAQFEHAVLVTDHGAEILTVVEDGSTAVGTLERVLASDPQLIERVR